MNSSAYGSINISLSTKKDICVDLRPSDIDADVSHRFCISQSQPSTDIREPLLCMMLVQGYHRGDSGER